MDLQEASTLAKYLMSRHLDMSMWRFEFDRSLKRFGCTHFGTHRITLSYKITQLNDEAEVRNTILHEIAHAMVGHKAGHGPVWLRQALAIGNNGDRCHEAATPDHAWEGTCPNGHKSKRHRLTAKSKQSSCAKCSARYNPDYLFTWKRVA